MTMLVKTLLKCDYPDCKIEMEVWSGVASDGRLIICDDEKKGLELWSVGENPSEFNRKMYVLCPKHSEKSELQKAIKEYLALYKGKSLTIDSLKEVRKSIISMVRRVLPNVHEKDIDITVETDGTISVSLNECNVDKSESM
jgi:hypothetical protein